MKLALGLSISNMSSPGDGSLKDVLASTVFDLDATKSASYPGTGTTWANLVTTPADGEAQATYNFSFIGTPALTFVGSAGLADAYFETATFNASNLVRIAGAANTAFLRDLHKTTGGSDFWIAIAIRTNTNISDTYMATLPALSSSNHGILAAIDTSERLTLWQRDGTTNVSALSTAVVQDEVDSIVIFSHSHSGNQSRLWYNSTTAQEIAHTFRTTTTNATGVICLFSDTDGGSPVEAGKRIYSFAMGNEYLDDTKVAVIIAALEARHGRDYTP